MPHWQPRIVRFRTSVEYPTEMRAIFVASRSDKRVAAVLIFGQTQPHGLVYSHSSSNRVTASIGSPTTLEWLPRMMVTYGSGS